MDKENNKNDGKLATMLQAKEPTHKCTHQKKEEVKSIDGKVLAFGFITIILVFMLICGALTIALYSVSSEYAAELRNTQQKQETILVLRRSLDRAEGKLAVYEEFITDRRKSIVEKYVTDFLRKTRTKSDMATVYEFERWVGIGGD